MNHEKVPAGKEEGSAENSSFPGKMKFKGFNTGGGCNFFSPLVLVLSFTGYFLPDPCPASKFTTSYSPGFLKKNSKPTDWSDGNCVARYVVVGSRENEMQNSERS